MYIQHRDKCITANRADRVCVGEVIRPRRSRSHDGWTLQLVHGTVARQPILSLRKDSLLLFGVPWTGTPMQNLVVCGLRHGCVLRAMLVCLYMAR